MREGTACGARGGAISQCLLRSLTASAADDGGARVKAALIWPSPETGPKIM